MAKFMEKLKKKKKNPWFLAIFAIIYHHAKTQTKLLNFYSRKLRIDRRKAEADNGRFVKPSVYGGPLIAKNLPKI